MDINGDCLWVSVAIACGYLTTPGYGNWWWLVPAVPRHSQIIALLPILFLKQILLRAIRGSFENSRIPLTDVGQTGLNHKRLSSLTSSSSHFILPHSSPLLHISVIFPGMVLTIINHKMLINISHTSSATIIDMKYYYCTWHWWEWGNWICWQEKASDFLFQI